jgi:membrane-bound ClpP family serine protease
MTWAAADSAQVEVIEVGGLLDDARLRFLIEAVESAAVQGREVAILQLNAPAVTGSLELLEQASRLLADPPLPLVAWLGPAPARVGGGAAQMYASALLRTAAPGTTIENWSPAVAGGEIDLANPPSGLLSPLRIDRPVEGLVDRLAPSIRQLVQDLDGLTMTVHGEERLLTTITAVADGGGVTTVPTVFTQPGLWHRFVHLGASPEAAFFFLAAGLTLAAFEFYAIGPGVAAAVAAVSLFLAGYGLATLPVRWWGVAGTVGAIGLLTAGYQRGGVLSFNLVGSALLIWSGFGFVSGAPQVRPGAAGVLLSVAAVLFFFLLAIPAVGRARFSTNTIGRTGLIGRKGQALVDFGPDGVVEIDGARWPASAHRAAGIKAGSVVAVVSVAGRSVEVEPDREN